MNAYQSILNNLSLSEDAKRNISKILQSEWERERAQNSFSRRAKIGAAIAMASVVAICAITIPFGIQSEGEEGVKAGDITVGIDTLFKDDNGTFCWREIAYAKTILSGDTLYESSQAGFLIVKAEFDFASYRLEEFGIMLRGGFPQEEVGDKIRNYTYFINFYPCKDMESGEDKTWLECKIKEDGDLNLGLTKAFSTDLHIFGEPGEVHGTAFLCVEVDDFVHEYLSRMHDKELAEGKKPPYHDIVLAINHIRYPRFLPGREDVAYTTTIACTYDEVNFFDSYVI